MSRSRTSSSRRRRPPSRATTPSAPSRSFPPACLPRCKKLPRYETYPAILIGRLALDQRYQGQGLGRLLLVDALSRCLDLSTEIGAIAVVVDAKDDKARAFYEHVGFLRLLDNAYRLYIPMASIAHLLRQPVQVSGKVVTPS